jgi:hypothetical protein
MLILKQAKIGNDFEVLPKTFWLFVNTQCIAVKNIYHSIKQNIVEKYTLSLPYIFISSIINRDFYTYYMFNSYYNYVIVYTVLIRVLILLIFFTSLLKKQQYISIKIVCAFDLCNQKYANIRTQIINDIFLLLVNMV